MAGYGFFKHCHHRICAYCNTFTMHLLNSAMVWLIASFDLLRDQIQKMRCLFDMFGCKKDPCDQTI
jgi:hypothetical protein